MCHIFFIHSSVDGHLGCFHILTIVNSAAMNIVYMTLFELWFSQGICPVVGLLVIWQFYFSLFKEPPYCYPYVCSLHLWLYFCFVNKIVYTNFFQIPHTCVNIWYLLVSFWLTSLSMTVSRSIHVSTNDPILFLFNGWVIFHCIYVSHLLYPFLCWWAFRLFLCPCYCK